MVLLNPRNRENVASLLRTGQNLGLNTLSVIGGFVNDRYGGNIHKFSHQMDTQDGPAHVTLLYFKNLESYLKHLPAQTTLVVVETLPEADLLNQDYSHPNNGTYFLGPELKGISKIEFNQISDFFEDLHSKIPSKHLKDQKKTAHLSYLKINTPASLNLAVCGAIILYDRWIKVTV